MSEPFRTQNRQLAFALACAGCEFAPAEDDGPAINIYSIGFLRTKEHLVKGKKIEDAARELIKRKIPGIVTYCFVRNSVLEETVKAWDDMVEEFQLAEKNSRQPNLPKISHKVIAQVLCVAVNNQKEFSKVPFANPMRQMVSTVIGSSHKVPLGNKPDPRVVIEGKGKVWTVGASKEMKEHLKV